MPQTTVSILGLLSMKPMHGYELNRCIRGWNMDKWARIPVSTVYRRLKKLEEEGLVASAIEQPGNMPPRTVLSLTSAGRGRLAELLIELIERTAEPGDAFKLASFFIGLADPVRVGPALQARCDRLAAVRVRLQMTRQRIAGPGVESMTRVLDNTIEQLELAELQTRRYLDLLRADPQAFFALRPQAPTGP